MFKKYLPVLNKEVKCNYWNAGVEENKWLLLRRVQSFKNIFTNEGKYWGGANGGIALPKWRYKYVPNPNAVNEYIDCIDDNAICVKITKFKNKEEEVKYKHIKHNKLVITIPKEEGWVNKFINIVFKKNIKGEPIVEWWWVNGREHRNSLKAKKLN